MKKKYVRPTAEVVEARLEVICGVGASRDDSGDNALTRKNENTWESGDKASNGIKRSLWDD